MAASHELTLMDYQTQLKTHIKSIYDNYIEVARAKSEHMNFEVQVKAAEIVKCYQSLMQLVSDIRSFLVVNDLLKFNQPSSSTPGNTLSAAPSSTNLHQVDVNRDNKLVKLRDEMSMFLYELEIPLP